MRKNHDTTLETKIAAVRANFMPFVGERLARYESAQIMLEDGMWEDWNDLPIRLFTDSDTVVSISWSKFDDLWLSNDTSLPFSITGSTVRWQQNAVPAINSAIGQTIRTAMLGRGEMSIEGNDVEVWTRLLIRLDEGWLEVFNALDENNFDYHAEQPKGTFLPCF